MVLVGGLSAANASHNLKKRFKKLVANDTIFDSSLVMEKSDTSEFHTFDSPKYM